MTFECFKIKYSSQSEANKTANQMRRSKKTARAEALRAYLCENCGKYHLTTMNQKKAK